MIMLYNMVFSSTGKDEGSTCMWKGICQNKSTYS